MADGDVSYAEKKDYLTQCYTRDFYFLFLWRQAGVYESTHTPFTVMLTDLDRFKFYNDKYGHLCGDELLKYYASSLRLVFENEGCVPFRLGGDEFLLVFPGKTSSEVYRLAHKLKKNLRGRPCLFKGRRMRLTFSGGIACFPQDGKTIEVLLENADKAMYHSKKHGRNAVTEFEKIQVIQRVTRWVVIALLPIIFLTFLIVKDQWNKGVIDYVSQIGRISWDGMLGVKTRAESAVKQLFGSALTTTGDSASATAADPIKSAIDAAVTGTQPATEPSISIAAPVIAETPQPPTQVKAPAANLEKDTVYLKSGSIMKGVIIKETDETVIMEFPLSSGGTGVADFSKSKIAKIERSAKKN